MHSALKNVVSVGDKMARVATSNPEDFPSPKPVVKSSISVVPPFMQESFLRQKYEVEGLSIGQIASLIFSAKSTVSKRLRDLGVAIRARPPDRKGQFAFGEKVRGRHLSKNLTEIQAVEAMQRLRIEGYSLREIAAWLDAKGVKTKNRKRRWQAATVLKILRRNIVSKA